MSEWHLFLSYHVFSLSFAFPVLTFASWKRPLSALLAATAVCLAPTVVFPNFYNVLIIDPFLGMAFGYGLYMVFSNRYQSSFDLFSVCLTISVLVLSKESGGLIGLFLGAALICSCRTHGDRSWKPILLAAAFLLIPKLVWELHVNLSHCTVAHSGDSQLQDLIRFITLQDVSGFRYETLVLFIKLQYGLAYHFLFAGHKISYLAVFTTLFMLALIVCPLLKKTGILDLKSARTIPVLFFVFIGVYVIGMCYVYLFRMPQWDAVGLSEMDRYYNTLVLPLGLSLVYLFIQYLLQADRPVFPAVMICLFLLVSIPWKDVSSELNGASVQSSQKNREPFSALADTAKAQLPPGGRIYIIAQGKEDSSAYAECRTLRYLLLPAFSESVTLGSSDWAGDFQTDLSCEELISTISSFDLVITYYLDNYFYDTYSDAFENIEQILPYAVYRVDSVTGRMKLTASTSASSERVK